MAIEFVIAAALIAFDQLTKIYIYQPIADGASDIILIKGVLRFTAVENTGASFGVFSDSTLALTIISLITVIALFFVIIFTANNRNPLMRAALVMILAGGLGNVIDRFMLQYVRDFIYFELIDFAVFNVADSCLTVGTIILIIYIIFYFMKDAKKAKDGGSDNSELPNA